MSNKSPNRDVISTIHQTEDCEIILSPIRAAVYGISSIETGVDAHKSWKSTKHIKKSTKNQTRKEKHCNKTSLQNDFLMK